LKILAIRLSNPNSRAHTKHWLSLEVLVLSL
jgi:hypothetical protein